MLKHIVFIKLKGNYAAEEKERILRKIKEMLDALPATIDVIDQMETGMNFSTRASAFDLALTVQLKDEEALNEYRVHPEHKKVLDYMGSLALETAVVDYFTD
jgi:hypothetical protein